MQAALFSWVVVRLEVGTARRFNVNCKAALAATPATVGGARL
jgi:hypothetical protein